MNILYSLIITGLIFLIALFGVNNPIIFGVVIPYVAIGVFVLGIIYRVVKWAKSPVPFRWPTTSGQQKSLPWIKANNLESPYNIWGVLGRMFLEVLLFRSLFRNTKVELREGPRIAYGSDKYLWLGAMAFHWCLLIIFLRHFRFFTEPVIGFVTWFQKIDGLFDITVPTLYLTTVIIVIALLYLLARRVFNPQVRYISLIADYLALFLILGVVLSGIWMRYFDKVNIVKVKEFAMGLFSFSPVVPEGIGSIFYIHLFFVCILIMYFPYSKLMHMAGVFFSPTRNLSNNNRMKRHINPWNPKVKVHTYQEYEDEFRDKIKSVGLPLEKE
jgi:nitrate reductase gamma subunit